MKLSNLLILSIVAATLTCPAAIRGETARQSFARGNKLLEKGKFQSALKAYSAAAHSERANQQYAQQFMLVRRVIALRDGLEREKDPRRWQRTAQSLQAFYVGNGIYPEAVAMGEQLHAKLNSAFSAVQLAETQLTVDNAAGAAKVLSALGPEKSTPATQALLAVALVRQDRKAEARKIAENTTPPKDAGPGTLYSLARMQAAVGNNDRALQLLKTSFEAVRPSRLDNLKSHARQAREFAALASTGGFAEVLETKSKVAESKCSSGSSCAGCPMRGKCSKGGGK